MRYSEVFIPTRREDPADAEVISHKLLVRAGYIRMLARGIYSFLPLGRRVLSKIEAIIRDEMNQAGAQEVLLPAVQPSSLWEESGRWGQYGSELLRFEDRKGKQFCFGPTHEEVITDLIRGEVRSYRQLPLNLYQIQTKFRDEIRPRAGLMRGREFVMKDAYSFDVSPRKALESYKAMRKAYKQTFTRMGLKFRAVDADSGAIGGSASQEFQVLAQSGEDQIVACSECGYAANIEKAAVVPGGRDGSALTVELGHMERVATPGKRTIEEVTQFLRAERRDLVKTIIYMADEEPLAVLVRGDHEVNELKVKALVGAQLLVLADAATVQSVTGAPVGFAGPVGLGCKIIADKALARSGNLIVGGNEVDLHLKNVNAGRDFQAARYADLRMIKEGDVCPRCEEDLAFFRGIEVGHIFYLGTKYSESMGAVFLDESGKPKPMEMGCYGMGVTRLMAAAVEQNHDENGICWPMPLAPLEVTILTLGRRADALDEAAKMLHDGLVSAGIEVLLDDRDERPAIKFKDADLIGIPLRIAVGQRGLKEGNVEVKWRTEDQATMVELGSAVEHVAKWVREARLG